MRCSFPRSTAYPALTGVASRRCRLPSLAISTGSAPLQEGRTRSVPSTLPSLDMAAVAS